MKNNKGFSLIEVLIATFIFGIVIFASVIIFSRTIGSKSRAEVLQRAQESLNFPVETITKQVRSAKMFKIGTIDDQCLGGLYLEIETPESTSETPIIRKVCYQLVDNKLMYKEKATNPTSYWSTLQSITADNIEVTEFDISGTRNSNSDASMQPFVKLKIELKTIPGLRAEIEETNLHIDTTITSRNIK